MEASNIPEFKALIERYETITLKEIKDNWSGYGSSTAEILTGYGLCNTCTLCIACNKKCDECVYKEVDGCSKNMLNKSYYRIYVSDSPLKLLNAYRNRAKVLREYAKDNNIEILLNKL